MKATTNSFITALISLAVPSVALSEPLKCQVKVRSEKNFDVFVPQSDNGRVFSEFTLDLSKDPDQGWQHQNMCVSSRDFKGAQFPGSLCLIVMSARAPAAPTGSPALYISLWHGRPYIATQPIGSIRGRIENRRMFSNSELVIPVDPNGQEVRWQQFFKTSSTRDIDYLDIVCKAE